MGKKNFIFFFFIFLILVLSQRALTFFLYFIYILAALGLSCGTRDLPFSMRDFLAAACELLAAACMRDLVPQPGIEPGPPALGARSLTVTHWTTR